MNIGIIGCGNISSTYLRLAPQFRNLSITACSDIDNSVAAAQAEAFGIESKTVDELLADKSIDLVINLTIPAAHAEISRSILLSGKHVYSEKPFVLTFEEGCELQALAREHGLRIGSAPDTFFGGAHQCARALVDAGELGDIVGGSCYFMTHGMEGWHPNPDFFYQPGAGPMLDMGAYYLSNLVQLVGPVKRLMAMSSRPFATRTISSEPRCGQTIPVDVATTINTMMEFHSGAVVTLNMSWDVWQHEHNCMELYGKSATLHVPDPNFFGGMVRMADAEGERQVNVEHPFAVVNDEQQDGQLQANYRGAGLADMIDAIENNRPHRCDDALALHVIDIMTSALYASESGQAVDLRSTCERPEAVDAATAQSLLVGDRVGQ